MCINSKAYNGNQGEVVCVTSSGLQIVTHSSKVYYFLGQLIKINKYVDIDFNNFIFSRMLSRLFFSFL